MLSLIMKHETKTSTIPTPAFLTYSSTKFMLDNNQLTYLHIYINAQLNTCEMY